MNFADKNLFFVFATYLLGCLCVFLMIFFTLQGRKRALKNERQKP